MNKCHFLGNLVSDPVNRTTNSGKTVVSFTIAINDPYKKEAYFLRCEAWEKTGENILKHFVKGKPIIVHGQMGANPYTDKNGIEREGTRLTVREFDFVPGGKQKVAEPKDNEDTDNKPTKSEDEEIPF